MTLYIEIIKTNFKKKKKEKKKPKELFMDCSVEKNETRTYLKFVSSRLQKLEI